MFKKNNNITKAELKIDKLYQYDDILLSESFIELMNNIHYKKQLQEKDEYQNSIISYLNKKHENNIKKQYNPKILKLYYDGKLIINNKEYHLEDFFIVYDDKVNNFHLKCIDSSFNNEEIKYNKAVKFVDTTAFINLIKKGNIINDRIIINNIDELNKVVKTWDGFLHRETVETDSIINKKMIKDDINEG